VKITNFLLSWSCRGCGLKWASELRDGAVAPRERTCESIDSSENL